MREGEDPYIPNPSIHLQYRTSRERWGHQAFRKPSLGVFLSSRAGGESTWVWITSAGRWVSAGKQFVPSRPPSHPERKGLGLASRVERGKKEGRDNGS